MNSLDINNIGHILGGVAFCYAAAWLLYRKFYKGMAAVLGVVVGVLANLIWEVAIDWLRLWPGMADPAGFDPYDPFIRGFIGAVFMGLYFYARAKR